MSLTVTEIEMEKTGEYNHEAARKNTLALIDMTGITRNPQEFLDQYPSCPKWILDAAIAHAYAFVDGHLDPLTFTETIRGIRALAVERVRATTPADKRESPEYAARISTVTAPLDRIHLQMATVPSMETIPVASK